MSFSPQPLSAGSSSIQEQRERWQQKHARITRELVKTEQHYCQQLELITTYFVEILQAKGTLKQKIRESIFSSIKDILSINQSLLLHLENGFVGKGLEQFCSHLHHYNTYVDNIENAKKVLAIQLKKNKAFRRFKKLQEARPQFNDQKLENLLQIPVQRIHQYKHFLQDLTSNTSPDHHEFKQISKAVAAVCGVSDRIHDNARRHENHLQLRRVQNMLKGRRMRVMAAGRWYIREGWLKIVRPKGKDAVSKMFFLFSDMLLETKRCSPLHPTSGEKFVGQHAYPLQEASVDKVLGHTKSKGGLLSLTFPKAKLLLMSSNQQDLNDWFQCLSSAVRKLQSDQTVVHQSSDSSRRPLLSAAEHNTDRKRNMSTAPAHGSLTAEPPCSAPKRSPHDEEESSEAAASPSCVIL